MKTQKKKWNAPKVKTRLDIKFTKGTTGTASSDTGNFS